VNARRTVVLVAAVALGVLLLRRQPLPELSGRLAYLRASAGQPLAARRLGGSSTDFDRSFFRLLEWARQRLRPDTPGVAVITEQVISGRRAYLALYYLAPIPTLVLPDRIPAGWLVLMQGPRRPDGWRVLAEIDLGALLAPSP
jgi:hypothetical protein